MRIKYTCLYWCLCFSLVLTAISGCERKPKNVTSHVNGYDGATWGMKKADVKRHIGQLPAKEADKFLIYEDMIANDKVDKIYLFDNNGNLFSVLLMYMLPVQSEHILELIRDMVNNKEYDELTN